MYSTKSNTEDRRYVVKCLMVSHYVATERFIVDTGAAYTCCYYKTVNRMLREDMLRGCAFKELCGMVSGITVRFYKYRLKQFTIGNIDMGEQDIWVTFDERITDIILGMDILKQIIMITNPYDEHVYFCKDRDDYNDHFQLAAG